MSTVVPFTAFKDAQEKRRDPKKYEARKIYQAIDRQVRAKAEAEKPSVTRGSGNVFADLGIPNAEEEMRNARAHAEKLARAPQDPLLIGTTPELDTEWDEEAGRYVPTITAGPLTRFFSNRDPGDENT
jgi:hypothetical protein